MDGARCLARGPARGAVAWRAVCTGGQRFGTRRAAAREGGFVISFVVAALNEAANIERCVRSVMTLMPIGEQAEVIVADNGSTDGTPALAAAAGARVVSLPGARLGRLRNGGVALARGDVLVFLDGDCALTSEWRDAAPAILAAVRGSERVLAGSHPIPPRGESVFLWTHWFIPLFQQVQTQHLGTAHLICRRADFHSIGGFDETLETNEDYDFCARMRAGGGQLLIHLPLIVEHFGFPRTIGTFFSRTVWHGRGPASTPARLARSPVALLGLAFGTGLIMAVWGLIVGRWAVSGAGLALAVAIVMASHAYKMRHAGVVTHAAALLVWPVFFAGHFTSSVRGMIRWPALMLRRRPA